MADGVFGRMPDLVPSLIPLGIPLRDLMVACGCLLDDCDGFVVVLSMHSFLVSVPASFCIDLQPDHGAAQRYFSSQQIPQLPCCMGVPY